MQIRVFPIEKECVRSPDLLQELPVHGQLINDVRLVELEPLVVPVLPAVVSEGSPEATQYTMDTLFPASSPPRAILGGRSLSYERYTL